MTKERKQYKFYLAASYQLRVKARETAHKLEVLTGWKSCARWLEGKHDAELPLICAEMDLADVGEADALIVMAGAFTRGGKWVEFGLAVGLQKPICVIVDNTKAEMERLPVFAYLTFVSRAHTYLDAAGWLNNLRRVMPLGGQ